MSNIFTPTPITTVRDVFVFTDTMVVLVDGFANSPFPTLIEDIKDTFDDMGCDVIISKAGTKMVDNEQKPAYSMSIIDRYEDPTGQFPITINEGEAIALGGSRIVEKVTL
ncbi:MAG: hypothetical protein H9W81_09880 [Enterococcus sp.]|nr:hypothetical protein [Enterococcus sp.]